MPALLRRRRYRSEGQVAGSYRATLRGFEPPNALDTEHVYLDRPATIVGVLILLDKVPIEGLDGG